jgi:hypothetical protein
VVVLLFGTRLAASGICGAGACAHCLVDFAHVPLEPSHWSGCGA